MTNKTEAQPEALRLADRLDLYATGDEHQRDVEDSADELRRQHAEIQQLKAQLSARQAAPDGQVDAARRRLAEAFPQAADCFHPLYIQGFKDGGMKGRYRGRAAALREVGAIADAVLATPPPPEREPRCGCETCRPITPSDMRMVLCPDCGNKRCPKATHHHNACTNSNAPGQPGSSWEHVKPHGATND